MPTLTVRNLPPAVVAELKARAAQNRRSLNGEVVVLLERAVLPEPVNTEALLAEADAWFAEPLPDVAAAGKRLGRKYEDDLREDDLREEPLPGEAGPDSDDPARTQTST